MGCNVPSLWDDPRVLRRNRSGSSESAPHSHGAGDSIEWEDDMVAINRETNTTNMVWQLIDRETGAKNGDISWKFTVGDRVKIRLVNEMGSDHPMPHPFHVHGAGRFLVMAKDGVPEPNLAWKDTVLLLAGQTVDILLYVTNPGLWMAHCHIAEHNQSGMMFSFDVAPAQPCRRRRSAVDREQPGCRISDRTPRGRLRRSRRLHGPDRSARRRRRRRRRAQVLRPDHRTTQGRRPDREDHRRRGDGRHL